MKENYTIEFLRSAPCEAGNLWRLPDGFILRNKYLNTKYSRKGEFNTNNRT